MKRLTEKDEKGKYYIVEERICIATEQINPIRTWITGNENRGYGKPIDKLGKLEDLEEQLGCPLDMYVSINENGIYIDVDGIYADVNGALYGWVSPRDIILDIKEDTIIILRGEQFPNEVDMKLKFSDYKKMWWLKENREE